MNNPKISVIIPAYNEEKYIEQAVNSVLSQSIKDFEIIIINDCSTDKTKEIIDNLSKKDSRVKPIHHKINKGRCGAVNTGIDNAKAEYISFLDADDFMIQNRLKQESEFLDNNPEIDMVYGDLVVLYEDGNLARKTAIKFKKNPKEILIESSKRDNIDSMTPAQLLDPDKSKPGFIPGGSVMLRKKVFEKVKLDENLKNSEDYDLWLQIIGAGFKLKKLDLDCFIYRLHGTNKSSNKEKMKIAAKYIIEKLKRGEYFKD
ncbi:hypothetical protein DRN73_06905 [Candidatus Pacearchaeota archaeon]|nr:MAG: hypothetical protein DRN73_06905 [Candidatus Pacearchaeota archaeon]